MRHEVRVCERLSNFADKSDKIKHKKQWYSICCAVWVTWHVARGGPPTQLSRANTKIINTPQSRPAAHCFYSPPSYEVQSKARIWVLNVSIVYIKTLGSARNWVLSRWYDVSNSPIKVWYLQGYKVAHTISGAILLYFSQSTGPMTNVHYHIYYLS